MMIWGENRDLVVSMVFPSGNVDLDWNCILEGKLRSNVKMMIRSENQFGRLQMVIGSGNHNLQWRFAPNHNCNFQIQIVTPNHHLALNHHFDIQIISRT